MYLLRQIDQSVPILMSGSVYTRTHMYIYTHVGVVRVKQRGARARWNSKFERRIDTWRACVTVAKGTTWLRPNGTARAFPTSPLATPSPSILSPSVSFHLALYPVTFYSTLSLRRYFCVASASRYASPSRLPWNALYPFHLSPFPVGFPYRPFFSVATRQSRTLHVA